MRSSQAALIPEELFEHILWHVCGKGKVPPLQTKRLISACASVCRYWAFVVRRQLFGLITLRNLSDVNRFREILDAPTISDLTPVSEIVYSLTTTVDSRDPPWLHLAFLSVVPRLRRGLSFIVNALHCEGRTWRTLHPSLPRSIPVSTVPVNKLDLTGLQFPNGHILSRLISSIPSVRQLVAVDITFITKPNPKDFMKPPFCRSMLDVTSNDHELALSFIPFLLANVDVRKPLAQCRGGRVPNYAVDEDDLATLQDLFGLLEAVPNFHIFKGFDQKCADTPGLHLIVCRCYKDSGYVAPSLRVYVGSWTARRPLQLDNARPVLPELLYVNAISIDLTVSISDEARDLWTESVWTRFAATALKFPHMEHVEVVRAWDTAVSSRARDPEYLDITETAFKPLIEAGKFRCRFTDLKSRGTLHVQSKALTRPKLPPRRQTKGKGRAL